MASEPSSPICSETSLSISTVSTWILPTSLTSFLTLNHTAFGTCQALHSCMPLMSYQPSEIQALLCEVQRGDDSPQSYSAPPLPAFLPFTQPGVPKLTNFTATQCHPGLAQQLSGAHTNYQPLYVSQDLQASSDLQASRNVYRRQPQVEALRSL